jgi:hypothetical protein
MDRKLKLVLPITVLGVVIVAVMLVRRPSNPVPSEPGVIHTYGINDVLEERFVPSPSGGTNYVYVVRGFQTFGIESFLLIGLGSSLWTSPVLLSRGNQFTTYDRTFEIESWNLTNGTVTLLIVK